MITFNWKINLPVYLHLPLTTLMIYITSAFSDPQLNEHGDYILGYVSIKLPNEFLKELLIETAYMNGYGYRVVEGFPFE